MLKNIIKTAIVSLCAVCATSQGFASESVKEDRIAVQAVFEYLQQDMGEDRPQFSTALVEEQSMETSGEAEAACLQERRHWIRSHHIVGNEMIAVKTPTAPHVTKNESTVQLDSSYHSVAYMLTSFIPAKQIDDPRDFFQTVLSAFSQYPQMLSSFDIARKNGLTTLELKTVNLESGVSERIKYVVTPQNLYILETIYMHGANEKHEHFFDSFELLR